MKILKLNIFANKNNIVKAVTKQIPPPPPFDRNNCTREEFADFVRYQAYLAENGISGDTFIEPDRFVTEEERRAKAEFKKRVERYRKLAEEGIGVIFSA